MTATQTQTKPLGRKLALSLTASLIMVLCFESSALAQSHSCSRGYASHEDKARGSCSSSRIESSGGYHLSSVFGAFVDVLDLGDLELQFSDSEVQAVNGLMLPALGTEVVGGVAFGVGGRLNGWVRLPEVTLTLGGATIDGPWTPLVGQGEGLESRATSMFLLRLEVAAGVEIPFRHVRPYLLGRAAGSLFLVGADLRDDRLGELGHEVLGDGAWELGTEAGLAFLLNDQLALTVGWRATWLGATGHGVAITLTGSQSLR